MSQIESKLSQHWVKTESKLNSVRVNPSESKMNPLKTQRLKYFTCIMYPTSVCTQPVRTYWDSLSYDLSNWQLELMNVYFYDLWSVWESSKQRVLHYSGWPVASVAEEKGTSHLLDSQSGQTFCWCFLCNLVKYYPAVAIFVNHS